MTTLTPRLGRLREIRLLLDLALPIVTVQVGLMLMGVVDAMLVGRLSPAALAAAALGNLAFVLVCLLGQGVLMALDPLVAQAVGAGEGDAIAANVQRGLVLAAVLTVPLSQLLLPAEAAFRALGQPADVVPDAARYVIRIIPGVFPFLAFVALRQVLQALGHVRAVVLVIVAANLLNAGLDLLLIFGQLGFPALGVAGSAWATTIARWAMLAMLVAGASRWLRPTVRPWRASAFALGPLRQMVRLGLPIGLQLELEIGAFGAVALLMGRLGTREIAAHQVAINLASLTFMVPLGLGAAAAVLVGRAVGRGDMAEARRAARTALWIGAAFMAAMGLAFVVWPGRMARLYSSEGAVVQLAAALLPIAGVFQIFDGLQAVAAGILRGAGDMHAALRANLVGFWLIGMPLSIWLGFRTGLGARGLWWGLVAGLGVVAVVLVVRTRQQLRGPLGRTTVDVRFSHGEGSTES